MSISLAAVVRALDRDNHAEKVDLEPQAANFAKPKEKKRSKMSFDSLRPAFILMPRTRALIGSAGLR